MTARLLRALAVCAVAIFAAPAAAQQGPLAAPTTRIEVNTLLPPGVQNFDPGKATDAYLARISPKDKARSDAYFEGGYVLSAVDVVYVLAIAALLMWLRLSARMRDYAAKCSRFRPVQTALYAAQYVAATTVLSLPLAVYEEFIREHAYGLSNQSFAQWTGEFAIAFLLQLVAFSILLTVIYAVARKVQSRWWVWGAGISIAFLAVMVAAGPVFIAPLFNKYTPLPDSAMKSSILSLARSQGIPARDVYTSDASKQSKRISADVSGLFGTTRITLNDNLLNRCTPSEVMTVMGHEMGHYVMNHIVISITWLGLVIFAGFWFVNWTTCGLLRLFGARWRVEGIADPAGLPVIMAMFSLFFLLATPVNNTITRTQEIEADIFGLNAVRLPDAAATVYLKLGEYRKLDPSPLEEAVFFDHPSGRTRIYAAMRWKAGHIHDPDILNGPLSPQ
jgi:STE24 endopeptidase